MRLVVLIALLSLAGACRSRGDYYSLNRSSIDFLKETMRKSRAMRKDNLKETVQFAARRPRNRQIERESRSFAWETLWQDEGKNLRSMLAGAKREVVPKKGNFWKSVRFGHLDTGE